tara:strand:- start:882 stop:1655 length:774 start_codon:yes stop_codon:yes gene_type:complete
MRVNTTKNKLSEGFPVFGPIINEYSPGMVEIFGALDYDFVMIDCEHGSMNVAQVENMVRASESFGITPIARIPDHNDATILRFLDRGVQGIIVPHVNTRSQAESISRAARYYPEGHRGVGGGRSHNYGVGLSRSESTSGLNSNLLVIPMIEEVEAVQNVDEIASVEGVDILHVAPGDLAQSMGNASVDEVRNVMDEVIPKIKTSGKWSGVGGNSPSDITRILDLINLGANFVTVGANAILIKAAQDFKLHITERIEK